LRQVSLGCERHLQDDHVIARRIAEFGPVMTGNHDQRLGISAPPDRPDRMTQILLDRVPIVAHEPGL
jgi:hypothetical protein